MTSATATDCLSAIAILRGVTPERVVAVGDVLYAAGFRAIEVPLNSPDPFASIAALAACGWKDCHIGAGTVLKVEDVQRTRDAGGDLVVTPNCDPQVIGHALQLGLTIVPGFATATEALQAVSCGAKMLKLFPASTYGPRHLKALRAVLPTDVGVVPVGGVDPSELAEWLAAGAVGFGFGSELYRPQYSLAQIEERAEAVMLAAAQARRQLAPQTPS